MSPVRRATLPRLAGLRWPLCALVLGLFAIGVASVPSTGLVKAMTDHDKLFYVPTAATSTLDRVRFVLHQARKGASIALPTSPDDTSALANPPDPDYAYAAPLLANEVNTRWLVVAVTLLFCLAFGFFVVLGSLDQAAFWLGVFCLCITAPLVSFFGVLDDGTLGGAQRMLAAGLAATALEYVAYYALFKMADALCAANATAYAASRVRRWIEGFVAAGLVTVGAIDIAKKLAVVVTGQVQTVLAVDFATLYPIAVGAALCVVPLALLTYARVIQEDDRVRRRLRIISYTVLAGLAGYLLFLMLVIRHEAAPPLLRLSLVFIPIGFVYAIPAYRVFDLRYLSRSVVFVIVLGGLVALISVVHLVIADVLVSFGSAMKDWSTVVVVIGTCIAILFFSRLERALESKIEHWLYRKRYDGLAALDKHVDMALSTTDAEVLTSETAAVVRSSLAASSVALYLGERGEYQLRKGDENKYGRSVGAQDPAVRSLARKGGHVNLSDFAGEGRSRIAEAGYAFSLTVSGMTLGLLACGPRADQNFEGDYMPDEIEATEHVARAVAQALLNIRATALLDSADDGIDAPARHAKRRDHPHHASGGTHV